MAAYIRTLVFRIHNPSRRTAATLYRALSAYTRAAARVLDMARRDWNALRAEGTRGEGERAVLNTLQLTNVLSRRYAAAVPPATYPLHSTLRSALFADLAAQLVAYDALVQRWTTARARLVTRIEQDGLALDPPDPRALALLETLGRPPAWPSVPLPRADPRAEEASLQRLAALPDPDAVHETPSRCDRPTDRLLRLLSADTQPRPPHPHRSGTGTRPLTFPRMDGVAHNRNAGLVRASHDGRYYALLYLLPAGDPHARPLHTNERRGDLVALHTSGGLVDGNRRRASSALLLPLECGRWHVATALEHAAQRPEMVRTAKLYHRPPRKLVTGGVRPEGFYLAVALEFAAPEQRTIAAHMGVSMDEQSRVGWAVHDPSDGRLFAAGTDGSLMGLQERWRADRRMQQRAGRLPPRQHHRQATQVEHAAHILVNHLVAVAAEHGAQVAVEDVTYLRDRRAPVQRTVQGDRAARSAAARQAQADQQYRRATLVGGALRTYLEQKLPRVGLPRPLIISGISPRDCHACGRRGAERDLCGFCGAPLDVANTARITAARVAPTQERVGTTPARRREERAREDEDDASAEGTVH